MRRLGLVHGLILAEANEASISVNGMTIAVRSLAEWLLAEGGESRR
jgi:hypothetical protein